MRVSIPVCHGAAVGRSAAGRFLEGSLGGLILVVTHSPVLGRVIRRADTGGHTQQPLITVDDDTIV